MTALSDFLENALINATLRNVAYTSTCTWISLHTGSPTASGDQSSLEVAYPGYARLPITRDGTGFTVAGGGGSNTSTYNYAIISNAA